MRDCQKERRLTWYILIMECVAVLYALRVNYSLGLMYIIIHAIVFAVMVIATRLLTVADTEKCPDFVQGAVTIACGVYVYMCYSVGSGSDRLLPACMFFVVV